jgi:hypothetical protein
VTRLAIVGVGALLLGSTLAGAPSRATPTSSATSSATPAASASTPVTPGSSAPSAPRAVLGADLPREPTRAPTAAEWSHGRDVTPTRGHSGLCALTLLREWLRVRCPGVPGAGLVAGDTEGVSVRTLGRAFNDTGLAGDLVTIVVLPLRPGQSRIVSFNQLAIEYDSTALVEGGTLSVVWRTGRPDPVLAMYGIPKEPSVAVGPE